MKRTWWMVSVGILAITLVVLFFVRKDMPSVMVSRDFMTPLAKNAAEALGLFRQDAAPLSEQLQSIRTDLSAVAALKTPIPKARGLIHDPTALAVMQSDQDRQRRLNELQQRLGEIGTQLVDLQQRATALELRIQESIRDMTRRIDAICDVHPPKRDPVDLILVGVGLLSSLCTMVLAIRKDAREARKDRQQVPAG
jgi:hypothetical protein